ncbi:glycoside hydrolase 43 family protein [Sphingobium lactosutens]|uniref:glycoside hydrolase family 43 protein n=1 Tax=Sphingobium lactosutens TaxID=522773 RepID=UPI0015BAC222|nr:glycoside hydrolase family 43 protein [Sphingobium lactosutens]NWK95724.1 glycoside hydrolase 43 family protein [Sphingobium lactosutens]
MRPASRATFWLLASVIGPLAPALAGPARFEDFRYDGRAQEQATPGPGDYRNPILSGYYPDPSITRVGDAYYLVNSSFAHYPGLPIFTSTDMVHWRQIGNAIDRPGQFDFSGLRTSRGMFAPDISWHDGHFYLVGTCVDCRGNFVMTARDPAGPWSDPTWLPFEGIDPSLYWEGDRAFIVNNRAPDEPPRYDGHRAIWVQEFDWRTLRMTGPSTQIVNGGVDIAQKPAWIEGPHLLKREGYYYLIAAEGGTGDQHSEVVFRSPDLRRPFTPYLSNPILSQRSLDPARPNPVTSAGHAKLIQTQAGDWWATFLATRPYGPDLYNIGRETFLLPVEWRDGWPHILDAGKPIPFTAPRPDLPSGPTEIPSTSGDFSYHRNDFTGTRLDPAWIGIRTPARPVYRLEQGALVLDGATAIGDLSGAPAFIGRRQQHHVATVSTTLDYRPEVDGDRAGLVAIQSDRSFLFFGLIQNGGTPRIALMAREGSDSDRLIASTPIDPARPVTLTLALDGGRMRASYVSGGAERVLASDVDIDFLSTKQAGGFVGTIIGPYAWAARVTRPSSN